MNADPHSDCGCEAGDPSDAALIPVEAPGNRSVKRDNSDHVLEFDAVTNESEVFHGSVKVSETGHVEFTGTTIKDESGFVDFSGPGNHSVGERDNSDW